MLSMGLLEALDERTRKVWNLDAEASFVATVTLVERE